MTEEVKALREALNKLACWGGGSVVTGRFDDPYSAKIAREALIKADSAKDWSADSAYFIAIGINYLRVFRYHEALSLFSRRTGIEPMRLSHLETGKAVPTASELATLRAVHEAWNPEPPYGPGNPLPEAPK